MVVMLWNLKNLILYEYFCKTLYIMQSNQTVSKTLAQIVSLEINIELKHSPLMNKKNKTLKWVMVTGYWSCRTLQSANEGYVAWQNSVIATHKWGIRQDVANGKQSHLTWLLGSSCSISEQQAGSQKTGGGGGVRWVHTAQGFNVIGL